MCSNVYARVAYQWAETVGGLILDDDLAAYAAYHDAGCNVAQMMAASPAKVGSNVYTSDSTTRRLSVPLIGSAREPLDVGNGILRPSVLLDGASTTSTSTSTSTSCMYASTWSLAGAGSNDALPASLLTADLATGIVTATTRTFDFVTPTNGPVTSTVAALRTYPNLVLQSLSFAGTSSEGVKVTHALCAPPGAMGATFAASTFATPGSNVLVRAVGGECIVGSPASSDVVRVLARAAYVLTGADGLLSPSASEMWLPTAGVYETTFLVTPPATLSVLVAHGLGPAAAMRTLGAAVDDLASGTLLSAHGVACAALISPLRVEVAVKAQAAADPGLAQDAAFHQLQLDAGLAALLGAVPSQVGLDADLWVVPPLLLISPEAARPFLQARLDELPAARDVAKERGVRGALFLPPSLSPAVGSFAADSRAPLPLYRSGLASLATWNFFRATRDVEWLRESGYPLLRDVADAFTTLLTVRVGTTAQGFSTASLPRVVAPDGIESDDDPFTRVTAYWAIKNALEASYELGFAGRSAWTAIIDLQDALGRNPLVSDVTASSAPLAASWPLGFCFSLLAGQAGQAAWPAPSDAPSSSAVPAFADGTLDAIARAAFYAMRAQAQPLPADRASDAGTAHAQLTAAMRSVESRPWGVTRDPLVCGAYLLLHLSVYGRLSVTGGISRQRYSYAPYGVPVPEEAGLALPPAYASVAFRTVADAGYFLMTNELPWIG